MTDFQLCVNVLALFNSCIIVLRFFQTNINSHLWLIVISRGLNFQAGSPDVGFDSRGGVNDCDWGGENLDVCGSWFLGLGNPHTDDLVTEPDQGY